MKKFFLITFLITLVIPFTAYALELDFPSVSGIKPTESFGPANWINYIFVFGLGVVGLLIIGSLVYAGFLWMAGAENSSKINEAKDRIMGSIIGLIILLGSYVFLNTINPQLVSLKNPKIMLKVESDWWSFFRPSEDVAVIGAGAACNLPSDCREGYTCTQNKCTEVTVKFTGTVCHGNGYGQECATGERCFQQTGGDLVSTYASNVVGVCSNLKALGEECNPDASTNECMGKCDTKLKRCARI